MDTEMTTVVLYLMTGLHSENASLGNCVLVRTSWNGLTHTEMIQPPAHLGCMGSLGSQATFLYSRLLY